MAREQSMEWKMEEKFSLEWNIFRLEWKWNERKLPVWNMEKSSSIPFHTNENDTTPWHTRAHTQVAELSEKKRKWLIYT